MAFFAICRKRFNNRVLDGRARKTISIDFAGIVSIVLSLRVDRLYENKITWTDKYKDPESQEYQQLEHESVRAVRVTILYISRVLSNETIVSNVEQMVRVRVTVGDVRNPC